MRLSLFPFIRLSITSFTRLSVLKMCPTHRFFLSNIVFKSFTFIHVWSSLRDKFVIVLLKISQLLHKTFVWLCLCSLYFSFAWISLPPHLLLDRSQVFLCRLLLSSISFSRLLSISLSLSPSPSLPLISLSFSSYLLKYLFPLLFQIYKWINW